MGKLFSILSLYVLCSCTVHPTIRKGDTVVTLGGSAFSKKAGENAYYKGPLGEMGYATVTSDETIVPSKVLFHKGVRTAVNAADSVVKTALP